MKKGQWKRLIPACLLAVSGFGTGMNVHAEEGDEEAFFSGVMEFASEEEEWVFTAPETSDPGEKEFAFTGGMQSFTAPVSGTYTLEVWGASGGASGMSPYGSYADGGKGGYAKGETTLQKGQTIYIAVGGEGSEGRQDGEEACGGFNGGGNARGWKAETEYDDGIGYVALGSGGGATSIALAEGELRTLENAKDQVLIVAAGGGGGAAYIWKHAGGEGGGLNGGNGTNLSGDGEPTAGNGATQDGPGTYQTSGGFGYGGSHAEYTGGKGPSTQDAGTGGGAGWYGGGGGYRYGVGGLCGGGGSSYIGGVQNGTTEAGVNSGSGRARITWVPGKEPEVVEDTRTVIRYLDEADGSPLAEDHSEKGEPGTPFTVTSPVIDGYLLKHSGEKIISGTLGEQDEIIVYYVKAAAPVKRAQDTLLSKDETTEFTIEVKNPTADQRTFTVRDTLPEGLQFVSADEGGIYAEGTVTWCFELGGGAGKKVHVTLRAVKDERPLVNTAEVKVDHVTLTSNPAEVRFVNTPVKEVLRTDGTDAEGKLVQVGEVLTYRIHAVNPLEETAVMTIRDELPSGMEAEEILNDGVLEGNTVTWEKETEAGETVTVEVQVRIREAGRTYVNTAAVECAGRKTVTNQTVVHTPKDPVKTVVNQNGDSVDGGELYAGEQASLTYGITVFNPSPKPVVYTITDAMTEGLVFLEADEGGVCQDGTVTWKTEVAANGEKTVHFKAVPGVELIGREIVNTALAETGDYRAWTNEVTILLKENPSVIDLEGEVIWEDHDNVDGLRPNVVTVHIFAGDDEVRMQQVLLDSEGKMRFTAVGLPEFSAGSRIVYSVLEDVPSGYTASVSSENGRFLICNVHDPRPEAPLPSAPAHTDPPSGSTGMNPAIETVHTQAVGIPNTGDGSHLLRYLALLAASAAMIVCGIMTLRPEKPEE